MLRTLSFWAFLIVGTVLLVQLAARTRQDTVEISYSDFTLQVDSQNVKRVEITERQRIKGDLNHPILVNRKEAEHFTTLLPFESSETWVASLRAKGVDVNAKDLRPSFGVIFINFLPYLLMLGLILFMVRQMQQGGNRAFAFGKSKAKLLSGDTPKVTFTEANRVTVTFRQHYNSGSLKVASIKTLVMVKAGEKWLIQQERAGS